MMYVSTHGLGRGGWVSTFYCIGTGGTTVTATHILDLLPHIDKDDGNELLKYNYLRGVGVPEVQKGQPYCSRDVKSLDCCHVYCT
jgi:hypothetical protein